MSLSNKRPQHTPPICSYPPEHIISIYNRWAEDYDESLAGKNWAGPQKLAQSISSIFNLSAPNLRVIDIGVGTGLMSRQLKFQNPDLHITGIDISECMLTKCREKGVVNATLQQDIQTQPLPFEKGHFNLAVSSGVFELLDQPEKVIAEMGRILSPSGVFAFTVYSDSQFGYSGNRHPDEVIQSAISDAGLTTSIHERFPAFDGEIYYHVYVCQKTTLDHT